MEKSKAVGVVSAGLLVLFLAYSSALMFTDIAAISLLQAQLNRERSAMRMETLLVVERINRQGAVVQRAEKRNDLPTKNFIGLLMWMFSWADSGPSSILNTTVMKDTTGTLRNWDTTGADFSFGLDYIRVGWGSGTVSPTINDYELNTLGGKDTVDQTTFFVNSTHMWVKIVMTSEFTSAYTIREIGLYTRPWTLGEVTAAAHTIYSNPATSTTYGTQLTANFFDTTGGTGTVTGRFGYSLGEYMLFRDVLGSAVDIPANEAVTITYYIYLKYA